MIERTFERKFFMRFTSIVVAGIGVIVVALYLAFPKGEVRHYAEAIGSFMKAEDVLVRAIIEAFLVESLVAPLIVVLIAVFASHKIAGPVYRLKIVLREMAATQKNAKPIKFRSYDQMQVTAENFNNMLARCRDNLRAINDAFEDLEETLKNLNDTPEDLGRLRGKVHSLGKAFERFTI